MICTGNEVRRTCHLTLLSLQSRRVLSYKFAREPGLGVAPRDVAGVALEHAHHLPGLDGIAVLVGVVAVQVRGVVRAVAAGLERVGPQPQVGLAGVQERAVVLLLRRVHVRHEDLRHEAAVEHPPPRAGVGVVDRGQRDDRAGTHVEAQVELPVGPPAVARFVTRCE